MHAVIDNFSDAAELDPEVRAELELHWNEVCRLLSPAGLDAYLGGALALQKLSRGTAPVSSYLNAIPPVARECGEDIIGDTVTAAMKLSSMTSGEVIALLFTSLPGVARNLGDAELLRGYLGFIHQFASTAARGLRPMLGRMDELLSLLTLGGLRRWANFGAQAYRRDFANLTAYFALESEDARAMLQKERRGLLFVKAQRKLNFYLRALWGRDFFLRPTGAEHSEFRPYIEHLVLYMPDALDDYGDIAALELYRATAAHMAAHLCYSTDVFEAGQLSPAEMFFIGLIEDARIECIACSAFPGLKSLWRSLLLTPSEGEAAHSTLPVLRQFALVLLDDSCCSVDRELQQIARQFHAEVGKQPDNAQLSRTIGLQLYAYFAGRKAVPSLRLLEQLDIPYRDDNRYIWQVNEIDLDNNVAYVPASERQLKRDVGLMEFINEVNNELAGDDAEEIWTLSSELFPYEDDLVSTESFNQRWGRERISEPFYYQEWDYRVQLQRPAWTTVYERRQPLGDPEDIRAILDRHKPLVHRIRSIVDLLTPAGVQRIRKLEDGDEIDLNAAVDATVAIRMHTQPDTRITMRNVVKSRDLAVLILLDLSESTNETVDGSEKTVLQLTREAASLVCTAVDGIGDTFAVHGFASDGRSDVQYYKFKDFKQPYNDEARARLAGMRGGLSTRMGAALRHAAYCLGKQNEQRKLILLVTDGEPADIDERDPQHLRQDTKKAVEELHSAGVLTYCLTLDPNADSYVKRIFGASHYTIVDSVERLPERLPTLFAALTS